MDAPTLDDEQHESDTGPATDERPRRERKLTFKAAAALETEGRPRKPISKAVALDAADQSQPRSKSKGPAVSDIFLAFRSALDRHHWLVL